MAIKIRSFDEFRVHFRENKERGDGGVDGQIQGARRRKRIRSGEAIAMSAPTGNGILVVDDSANIRHLLRVFVESKGFKVCGEAENGAEAIEKAKELQPELILLDLSMPVMTGTDAAPLLKKTVPHVKIILFTLHADGNKGLPSAAGVDLTLSKADSIKKLGEHLEKLLRPNTASGKAGSIPAGSSE